MFGGGNGEKGQMNGVYIIDLIPVHTSVTVSLVLPVIREVPIPSLCRHGFRSL